MIRLVVKSVEQTLYVYDNENIIKTYAISSAKKGMGEIKNSEQTPRGRHIIRAKIGANMPANTVFVGRRPTGEVYSADLKRRYPERDWILTRILWLSGTEIGKNRLGNVDTMRRYIYIHGSPDEVQMGQPGSHGCIRMHNGDVIELFDQVDTGTLIEIN